MKLLGFSTAAAVAAIACALNGVAANIDWASPAAYACSLENWAAIQQVVNGRLLPMWAILPPAIKDIAIAAKVVNPDHSLISNPTREQLQTISAIFPPGVFHPMADDIVAKCVDGYVPPGPSSSSVPPASSSAHPASSSSHPASSSAPPASSSAPPASSSAHPASSSVPPSSSSAPPASSSAPPASSSAPPASSSAPPASSASAPTTSAIEYSSSVPQPSSSVPLKCH